MGRGRRGGPRGGRPAASAPGGGEKMQLYVPPAWNEPRQQWRRSGKKTFAPPKSQRDAFVLGLVLSVLIRNENESVFFCGYLQSFGFFYGAENLIHILLDNFSKRKRLIKVNTESKINNVSNVNVTFLIMINWLVFNYVSLSLSPSLSLCSAAQFTCPVALWILGFCIVAYWIR